MFTPLSIFKEHGIILLCPALLGQGPNEEQWCEDTESIFLEKYGPFSFWAKPKQKINNKSSSCKSYSLLKTPDPLFSTRLTCKHRKPNKTGEPCTTLSRKRVPSSWEVYGAEELRSTQFSTHYFNDGAPIVGVHFYFHCYYQLPEYESGFPLEL
ncbi:hypothetical protein CDAR_220311 [Caerostris darwini]|uniref:Uncharacterized protein n=1 Tax=Caerostris darwini TaxID=1538125 RepID=A0AAV4UG43_9ARAC|nr:hypothetical protein CDAR_220311 [Caerostris darwini]